MRDPQEVTAWSLITAAVFGRREGGTTWATAREVAALTKTQQLAPQVRRKRMWHGDVPLRANPSP